MSNIKSFFCLVVLGLTVSVALANPPPTERVATLVDPLKHFFFKK